MPDPEPPTPERPAASVREAATIGLGFLMALGGLAWWLTRPEPVGVEPPAPSPRSADYARYVGDPSCLACHPGESAAHSRSGHSRTLRLAADVAKTRGLGGAEVADPEAEGVGWRFDLDGGRFSAVRSESGRAERFAVDWAFGSGRHASTFVTLIDRDPAHPTALEHRLTEFAHSKGFGLTPGQKATTIPGGNTPHGRVHAAWATMKCFSCHVTVSSDRGPDILDESTLIPNVGCERCHGPGRDHVEAARRGLVGDALAMPFGEGRWTDAGLMRLCGECHRLPEMGAPGETTVENASIVRHQPVGLMQSACYQKSDGKLGCVTCHDPHARTSTDRPSYESACLSCHGPGLKTPCPVNSREGCVACHMPGRDVGSGMMMSDHWIRVVPGLGARGSGRRPGVSADGPSD